MKNLKQLIPMIILFSVLIISGCKKEDNLLDAGTDGTKNTSGYPTPTVFNGASPKNALVVVRTSVSQGGFSFNLGVGVANLDNQDKGSVSVNVSGQDYAMQKNSSNGIISYLYAPSATNPTAGITLGSGAANATFSVSGYTLGASTVTVPGEIKLTAPSANSSVSRSSNLDINWTVSGSGTNKAICIIDKNDKSIFKEVSGSSGSFTVSEMGTLSAGSGALVYAITYNYVLTNNNGAVLIGEAVAFNSVTLQ